MAHHRRLILRKRGVSICVVEVPVGVNQPARRLLKRPSDGAAYVRNARAIARVDHRTFLGASNCAYRSAGSDEGKDRWTNLDNSQRSALVCSPRKFDKTAHREAVAVIHANSGLSSGHISLSRTSYFLTAIIGGSGRSEVWTWPSL
jgi:hypothetical protein